MKKILIISDGSVGEHFIQRAIETYTSENIYYIVQLKETPFKDVNSERFKFYTFDPTSLYKISNLLKMDFIQAFIVMNSQIDVENTIKNIRLVKKQLRVIVLDQWKLKIKDPNLVLVDSNELLASRFLDYLPNVPVIAQNVGIGEGEIMEVLVPFGSSFVYRHIGVIEQKNWRIVAIYRNRELIMPSRNKMIQPNDLLVLVGQPAVLKSVYRSIKRELGQFPEPFGSNIYLYIDMNLINYKTIKELITQALYVHSKFKHKLIIRIINPSDIDTIQYIKKFANDNIIIHIQYFDDYIQESFYEDIQLYHIGLIIVSKEMFANMDLRKQLYESHVPVLKIGDKSFAALKDTVVVLSTNKNLEKISTTVFDISEQLGFNVELYNYLNEHQEAKEQVIEHFYNLSTIFSKSIKVIKDNENPIRTLLKQEDFMQILPFTQKLVPRRIYSIFSTDSEKLYHKLDDYHQIFIPVQL